MRMTDNQYLISHLSDDINFFLMFSPTLLERI